MHFVCTVLMTLAVSSLLGADEQEKKPAEEGGKTEGKKDELPPPRLLSPSPLLSPLLTPNLLEPWAPLPEVGRRDVWQLFGVDGSGRFRPRVIYSPYGAYYYYNGAPYPWTTTRALLYVRFVVH